ncbi:MAG: hypothetical protein ABIF80_05495 [Patescibacteria group bacterium]
MNEESIHNKLNYKKIAFCLAIILVWTSLWVSFSDLPINQDALDTYWHSPETLKTPMVSQAGFPFRTFYFPLASMGNDIPDQGSFFPFALNTMIWFMFSYLVVRFLPKKWLSKRIEQSFIYSSFILSLVGLLWIILKYD